MEMTHEEFIEMQNQLQDHFDGRYVKITDCEKNVDTFNKSIHKDNVRLSVIEQQQKINNWLTLTIVGGIIALLIKVYLGG